MTRFFLLLFIIIFTISACEKDDFCTQNPVTPNLVIKFKNYNDTTKLKKPNALHVWLEGKDSIYKNVSLDSILLPLNSLTKETTYNLSVSKDSLSNITIKYNPEDDYVSRSCGFRVIFNNVKISENTLPTTWIDSIPALEIPTINNQANAHITLYH